MPNPTTAERLTAFADRNMKDLNAYRDKFQKPGLKFSSPPEAEVYRRLLTTAALPQILGQGWTSGTSAGSPASYGVYISNPGPDAYGLLFVTIFFGLANFADDIIEGFAGRDLGWPYRTTEGFSLAAGASVWKDFQYVVPTSAIGNTYTGNAVLWMGSYHDAGKYCDRSLFDITIH